MSDSLEQDLRRRNDSHRGFHGAALAVADERFVRVDGLVQWIGGGQMIVQADTGASVGVDLTSVPQDEYAGLGVRDRVAVIGMVSPDGRRVIGTSIVRSARTR